MEQITNWIKENKLMAGAGLAAVLLLIFGKKLMPARRRRRRATRVKYTRRRRARVNKTSKRRTGSKKPWQVKGSEAARRHMARLRRMR